MKIFLDTASLKEIREAATLGVVDGVTTNPSLLAKEQGEPEEILREICDLVDGPISAEVVATDAAGMIREGKHWASLHENITVKVPCTVAGIQATKALSGAGHKVNVTLIFSPTQALIAAKAGATFVSPFVGRLDDIATPGMEMVADIVRIFANYDYPTEVLAASLRHPMHVLEAARMGAHVGTMPVAVFHQLLKHPLTDLGLERFLADWEKAKKELGAKAR
ncbi:MAG: fructose-6-phosphate aldolase [Vicinamibacteria bacterium]|jgi:transaldolase|nr:fructose-6-phosphate aldolase [Vicinamibacteria bacterium]